MSTALNGTFQARGTLTGAAGALGSTLGNMLGGNLGQQVQGLAGKAFDQHADFRGTVTAVSHPTIALELAACAQPRRAGQCRRRCAADRRREAFRFQ